MNGLTSSQFKPLRDYLHRVPGHRRGSRCHLSTGIRWITKGLKNTTGEVVKLRAIRFGTRWMTSDVWFEEFLAAFIPADISPSSEQAPLTPTQRKGAAAAASAELNTLLNTSSK
ncbi:unnamed protein product [Gemmata massiliana]|uniref:Uncharacterized protein n=1 Tax=Gemmata massiliana TaxID=1210884 RepID=A0A6P2D3S3_9BACT|nr:hypothetical protein [Gemmata massiliana]VTR94102.1 unnamed protein product [Gemmata massiliana]